MKLTGGQVFDFQAGGFVNRDVCFEGGMLCERTAGENVDVSGCYVIPGLTDLHFHGCRGADLSDGEAAGLADIAAYELRQGVTQICPTGMTLDTPQLRQMCRTAAEYRAAAPVGAELVGINLEGPFLSPAKKGAQRGEWMKDPDLALLAELQTLSGGLVKLVTVAPERPGALSFIQRASSTEVTVSVGHTAADYDTALAAFHAGARQVTHLFNAMPPFSHREPGVVGAAADCPEVRVELICDGVHIHPAVVRSVFRLFGAKRVILISDTMRAAGMPDGEYTLGSQAVTVQGNRATLQDGTLAGSVTDLMACLRTAVSFGIPLYDAVMAAAVNPAQALGIDRRYGTLEVGKTANLVVLDQELALRAVYFCGEAVAL